MRQPARAAEEAKVLAWNAAPSGDGEAPVDLGAQDPALGDRVVQAAEEGAPQADTFAGMCWDADLADVDVSAHTGPKRPALAVVAHRPIR